VDETQHHRAGGAQMGQSAATGQVLEHVQERQSTTSSRPRRPPPTQRMGCSLSDDAAHDHVGEDGTPQQG
jgi:hypothetical protein